MKRPSFRKLAQIAIRPTSFAGTVSRLSRVADSSDGEGIARSSLCEHVRSVAGAGRAIRRER